MVGPVQGVNEEEQPEAEHGQEMAEDGAASRGRVNRIQARPTPTPAGGSTPADPPDVAPRNRRTPGTRCPAIRRRCPAYGCSEACPRSATRALPGSRGS